VQCGTMTVPEDRARPRGRSIALGVFRFPTRAEHPTADPVLQVGSDFHMAEAASDTALRSRSDSIYLAGRGFFGSKPRLTCPEISTAVIASLARPFRDPVNTTDFVGAAARCRARWVARGDDLSAYSLAERADDVRDLALVLHLSRVNLVAFGPITADAREIAGKYPQLVRSITLFNVTPNAVDANRWNGEITNAAGALDRYFGECSNQPACTTAFAHPHQLLIDRFNRLERAPQTYRSANPYSAAHEPVRILLDGDRAMQLALLALDNPSAMPLIPAAVASATSGRAVADFAANQLILSKDTSWGALLSRVCIDEIASVGRGGLSLEAQAEPELAFLADDPLLDVCGTWKTGVAPTRAPGPGTTPTLILEGELDPFTSREWAQQTAASFGHATVVQLPHLGNVASSGDPCITELRAGFLANPQQHIPVAACARSIPPIHFAGT
jgi:pimeloyl-ACP methyl ester carboxylesterase